MRNFVKVAVATGAFAALHSLLAGDRVKRIAAESVPDGEHLYRAAYNAQAIVTFTALTWYIASRPKRTIYRAPRPLAFALRAGQVAGVVFAIAAARATGISRLAGVESLLALRRGTTPPPPPIAQGPEPESDAGPLRIRGPFTIMRHPLNFAPLAPFWLTPHMTTRRLAFNLVATAYLIAGSWHEEQRFLRRRAEDYERYRESGVPFYLPDVNLRRESLSHSSREERITTPEGDSGEW